MINESVMRVQLKPLTFVLHHTRHRFHTKATSTPHQATTNDLTTITLNMPLAIINHHPMGNTLKGIILSRMDRVTSDFTPTMAKLDLHGPYLLYPLQHLRH